MKQCLTMNHACGVAVVLAAVAGLAGCGGGLGQTAGASVPPVNDSLYASVSSYCMTDALPQDNLHDGWTGNLDAFGNPDQFAISSIISAHGNAIDNGTPISMHVPHADYRGVTSTFVPSGYGKPDWVMGAAMPSLLAPHAVACVTQVARIHYSNEPVSLTAFAEQTTPYVPTSTLYWRSFWSKEVPVSRLSGYLVDGFEFVTDLQPKDGQVYFVLDKARYPTPQSMSLCFLAPGAPSWTCRQPTVADQGANWQVFQQGLQPGVYVLTSPTLP